MEEAGNYAIISDGYIVNVIWVLEDQAREFNAVFINNPEAGIGWKYENGVFIPPDTAPIAQDDNT
jgi:hypothetical protein